MPKNTVPLKTLLAVSEAAGTENLRPSFKRLHFKDNLVEATNGFMLIQVKLPHVVEEDFIMAEAVHRAARIERKVKVKNRQYRNYMSRRLSGLQPEAVVENGLVTVLGGSVKEEETLGPDYHYPQVDKVIPKEDQPMARVVLDPKYIIKACNAARKLGIEHLEFYFDVKKPLSPLLIKGKTHTIDEHDLKVVIMPINA